MNRLAVSCVCLLFAVPSMVAEPELVRKHVAYSDAGGDRCYRPRLINHLADFEVVTETVGC